MLTLASLSNEELLARLPRVVRAERAAAADVIAHLAELDRRRLSGFPFHATRPAANPRLRQTGSEFLRLGRTAYSEACSSLNAYCVERLGYSEEGAFKRVRVARLVLRVPRVLEELATGAIHLTGLFLLARVLTPENADGLLAESRGKSRADIEKVIATWFPRPDVPTSLGANSRAGDAGSWSSWDDAAERRASRGLPAARAALGHDLSARAHRNRAVPAEARAGA